MRIIRLAYIFSCCIFLFSSVLMAQELTKAEQEVENKVREYMEDGSFSYAIPHITQLLSLFPQKPVYNYFYGVCLTETNQDLEKAINYLEFAKGKEGVPPEQYFFLGKAYHLNYKFDKAIAYYEKYLLLAGKRELKQYQPERMAAMAENGKKLVKFSDELKVIERKNAKFQHCHHGYSLKNINGIVMLNQFEFYSRRDHRHDVHSTLYITPDRKTLYFSSYGKRKEGLEIYRAKKAGPGKWDKPEKLPDVINTPYDENYPFFLPAENTLIFSSKGHNSMGGYDIFKTTYDELTGTWSEPVNLDFPTNTPYDDLLYVIENGDSTAFFSSRRETTGEMIAVYHIRLPKPDDKKAIVLKPLQTYADIGFSTILKPFIYEADNTDGNGLKTDLYDPSISTAMLEKEEALLAEEPVKADTMPEVTTDTTAPDIAVFPEDTAASHGTLVEMPDTVQEDTALIAEVPENAEPADTILEENVKDSLTKTFVTEAPDTLQPDTTPSAEIPDIVETSDTLQETETAETDSLPEDTPVAEAVKTDTIATKKLEIIPEPEIIKVKIVIRDTIVRKITRRRIVAMKSQETVTLKTVKDTTETPADTTQIAKTEKAEKDSSGETPETAPAPPKTDTIDGIFDFSCCKTSEQEKIPINTKMPEGIVFRIQIAASKNRASPEFFKGIQPVSGDKAWNSAYIQYCAGYFRTEKAADLVKDEIRRMGFRYAFVVAYNNGRRIPVYQARAMLADYPEARRQQQESIAAQEMEAFRKWKMKLQRN